MKFQWSLIVLANSIFIVSAAGFDYLKTQSIQNPERQSASCSAKPLSVPIVALGRLEPAGRIIHCAPPAQANRSRLEHLLVKQAQRVKKGQILAILDGRAAHAASLYQAEMDLTVAEAELNRAKAPAKQQELKAEEAVVAKLEAELGNAEIEQHRYLSLRNEGAISASLMDSKNLIVNETAEDLLRAKANLASLSELRPSEIAVAEAQVERSKAAVKLARVQLDLDYVRAPIDAQVIKINTHEGETVDNKGILDLGDTRNMVAVAEVYESDFSRLRLGQLATISCDALPSTISGVVKEIGLQVEKKENLDPDPAADADSRIVEVRIAISGKDSTQVASYSNSHIRVAIKPETTKLCHR